MVLSLVLAGLSLLFGAGLLSRFMAHSNKQAVMQDRQERLEAEVAKHGLEIRDIRQSLALTAQSVENINARLGKLDLIEKVASDVAHIRELSAVRITAVENRVDTIENTVLDKLTKQ